MAVSPARVPSGTVTMRVAESDFPAWMSRKDTSRRAFQPAGGSDLLSRNRSLTFPSFETSMVNLTSVPGMPSA